jgi:hypothetical protein
LPLSRCRSHGSSSMPWSTWGAGYGLALNRRTCVHPGGTDGTNSLHRRPINCAASGGAAATWPLAARAQ